MGFGGGTILVPALLTMGFSGEEAAASACLFQLANSIFSTLQAIIYGIIGWQQILTIIGVSLVSSLIIVFLVKWIINKYGKDSIAIYIILAILILAFGLILATLILRATKDVKGMIKLHSVC